MMKNSQPFPLKEKCVIVIIIILIVIGTQLVLNATNFSQLMEIDTMTPRQSLGNGTIRIYPPKPGKSRNKPRVVMSLTAVPDEIPKMVNITLNNLLYDQTCRVDIIYLNIPYMQLRNNNKLYPSTSELHEMFPQDGVIINRILADSGPTTRYLGAIEFEKDPDTLIMTMDHDPWNFHEFTIEQIVEYSQWEPNSVWTVWGECIEWNPRSDFWGVYYGRYGQMIDDKFNKSWEKVEIFRAVNGVSFRRKWLDEWWYNSTDYNIGCFWTDDHWFSFNMARQGIDIKLIHDYQQAARERDEREKRDNDDRSQQRRLGTLTEVNNGLKSDPSCTIAIMKEHPDIWPDVRCPQKCEGEKSQ